MSQKQEWVVGHHAVTALLTLNPQRALKMLVVKENQNSNSGEKINELMNKAESLAIDIQFTDRRSLAQQCGYEQNQGIAILANVRQSHHEKELPSFIESLESPLLLVLDQVQDPHNFGACLRTADAAGVDAVIVAKDNACPITPVVQKVASGAAETVPIFRVTNLVRSLETIKRAGVWVIGTSDKASHDLFQESLSGPLALVMGAEGKGMRKLTERSCDTLVRLPMAGNIVSSLNVSVATGVCLYEIVRQRRS